MSARIWSREWFSTTNTSTFDTVGDDTVATWPGDGLCFGWPTGVGVGVRRGVRVGDGDRVEAGAVVDDGGVVGGASPADGCASAPHPASGRTTPAATASQVRVRSTSPVSDVDPTGPALSAGVSAVGHDGGVPEGDSVYVL